MYILQERWNPLLIASKKGHLAIVELLITSNVFVNARTLNNRTALHLAAFSGHTECVGVLLKNGANPKLKDKVRHLFYF